MRNFALMCTYVRASYWNIVKFNFKYVRTYAGINNTCFMCGKAEDVLPEVLNTQKMTADHVIGGGSTKSWTTLVVVLYCCWSAISDYLASVKKLW